MLITINLLIWSNKTNTNSNGSSSKSETNANLSSNNNLSSLSIDEAKISPEFSKDVYEYTAKVANDVEKITIHVSASDDNASVYGYGEKELVEGFNEFNVVVTAENGAEKTIVGNSRSWKKHTWSFVFPLELGFILVNYAQVA